MVMMMIMKDSLPSSALISSEREAVKHQHPRRFPVILYGVLQDALKCPDLASIISWEPCGTTFRIHDSRDMTQIVMPRYFPNMKSQSIKSFRRQLNIYGLKASDITSESAARFAEASEDGTQSPVKRLRRTRRSSGLYSHPSLKRDRPDLLGEIKRVITSTPDTHLPGKAHAKRASGFQPEDDGSLSGSSASDGASRLTAFLSSDKNQKHMNALRESNGSVSSAEGISSPPTASLAGLQSSNRLVLSSVAAYLPRNSTAAWYQQQHNASVNLLLGMRGSEMSPSALDPNRVLADDQKSHGGQYYLRENDVAGAEQGPFAASSLPSRSMPSTILSQTFRDDDIRQEIIKTFRSL